MGLLEIEETKKEDKKEIKSEKLTEEQKEIIDKELKERRRQVNNPDEPEERLVGLGGIDYRKYDDGFINDEYVPTLEEEREKRGI